MPVTRRSLSRREALFALAGGASAARRPNIVVIVSDDHGYADVSCYQHPPEVRTPNIDRIARAGVRFTQGYANAYVCAPTRAALLTGRWQQRFGFYTASDSREGLPLGERTLADLLRGAGYATGAFGKWHLGLDRAHHPLRRGFDEFYGFLGHGGHDYFNLKRAEEDWGSIWRNDKPVDETGYLTDNLGREAASFVARHAGRPFFLYLAFNAVHFPMQAPEETVRRYDTGNAGRNVLLAMLEHEDRAIGRVLDQLAAHSLERDTLVVFLSDNGGARNNSSNNGALRDYKHSVYEGGIRVPFLISWPAGLPAGAVCREPAIAMDVLPTAAAAAGVALPKDREHHGRNLLPAMRGEAAGPVHEYLFWDGDEGRLAVRGGRWKVVETGGRVELFDLEADPGEKTDLAARHPETAARLRAALAAWRKGNAPRIRKPAGERKKK